MKKLTKKNRELVRFILKRTLTDLKTAKGMTFKAYGSSLVTFDINFAMKSIESALRNLPKTKLPNAPQKIEKTDT